MRSKLFFFILLLLLASTATAQTSLDSDSILDAKAISQIQTLSIFIKCEPRNIPANSDGMINFTRVNCVEKIVTNVTNVNATSSANLTVYGDDEYPSEWSEPDPNSSEIRTVLRSFELNVSNTVDDGNYTIYFNLTKDYQLGVVGVSNVRLFWYNTSWVNLSTSLIENGTSQVQFSAISPKLFSKFVIGEVPSAEEESTPSGGTSSGGGTGGGGAGGGGGGGSTGGPTFIAPSEEEEKAPPESQPPQAPSNATTEEGPSNTFNRILSGLAVVDLTKPYWQAGMLFLILIIILLVFLLFKKRRAENSKDSSKRIKL